MSNCMTENESLSKEESVAILNSFYHPNKADIQRMDEIIERLSNIKEVAIYPDSCKLQK